MTIASAGSAEAPERRTRISGWWDVVAVGLIAAIFLLAFGRWLDNAHYNTSNGLWKSVDVVRWKTDFGTARLDPSNYLYFPAMGFLCRLLDVLHVHREEVWRQLAVISSLCGGAVIALMYWLVRQLFRRYDLACLAALIHLGSAFFLSLSVSNEDILPSYMLVLASMVVATLWFDRPAAWRVVLVGVLFSLGWLTEWRLIFPTLPPLVIALALSGGSPQRRAGLLLLFCATLVGTALLAANRWEGHLGAVGLPGLLWTGKGVATGWAGFSSDKLGLVAAGMGEYLLGGRATPSVDSTPREWGAALAVELVLLAISLPWLWRNRSIAQFRNVAIIFGGTLVAGQAMNAYSQPTDPQMQINVMPWLTVGATIALMRWMPRSGRGLAVGAGIAVLPLLYNLSVMSEARGKDGAAMEHVLGLERLSPPASTVYVFDGFEDLTTWLFVTWDPHWEGVCDLGPAPQPDRKFKWIALFGPLIHHPDWSEQEYTAAVTAEIGCAFDKGYRVVIPAPLWEDSAKTLGNLMTSINRRSLGAPLHALLHAYNATSLGGEPDRYYELKRP